MSTIDECMEYAEALCLENTSAGRSARRKALRDCIAATVRAALAAPAPQPDRHPRIVTCPGCEMQFADMELHDANMEVQRLRKSQASSAGVLQPVGTRQALRDIAAEFPPGDGRRVYDSPTETLDRIRAIVRAALVSPALQPERSEWPTKPLSLVQVRLPDGVTQAMCRPVFATFDAHALSELERRFKAPSVAGRKPLTEDEIAVVLDRANLPDIPGTGLGYDIEVARAIEAAHGIKDPE